VDSIIGLVVIGGLYFVICGGFGQYIAGEKRRGAAEGMLFGVLLGPFGLLVLALLPDGQAIEAPPAEVKATLKPERKIRPMDMEATLKRCSDAEWASLMEKADQKP
jgi:hypothetical protein